MALLMVKARLTRFGLLMYQIHEWEATTATALLQLMALPSQLVQWRRPCGERRLLQAELHFQTKAPLWGRFQPGHLILCLLLIIWRKSHAVLRCGVPNLYFGSLVRCQFGSL